MIQGIALYYRSLHRNLWECIGWFRGVLERFWLLVYRVLCIWDRCILEVLYLIRIRKDHSKLQISKQDSISTLKSASGWRKIDNKVYIEISRALAFSSWIFWIRIGANFLSALLIRTESTCGPLTGLARVVDRSLRPIKKIWRSLSSQANRAISRQERKSLLFFFPFKYLAG